jgi:IS5 family transposase
MFLKFRYGLGFESLCREVSDSITWRRFCRIALDGAVPHPTTLMKLNSRCGSVAVAGLNEALLAKAAEAKVLRTNRVRADTTVVPANVSYPTDSGLLAKAIRRITVSGRRIRAAGGAVRTKLGDRSRAAGKRAHGIAAKLRSRSQLGRGQVNDGVARITGELADLAGAAARDAQRLLDNARRALRRAEVKAAELAGAGVRDPPPRGGGADGWLVPSMTCRPCCKPPPRSPSRPGNGSSGPPPTAPAGWSVCTMSMRARSPRAGSGNPSSSVTRARSSTTTTASWWITRCVPETPPMHHNWPRRSNESKPAPVVHHGP